MTATRRSAMKIEKTGEYDIKKSMEKIGQLYPVLKSKDGKIIDGMHRKHIDKNWPEHVVDVSGYMVAVARIVANVQRREVLPKEKTTMLKELADETGWTAEQIAENTGMSISWVRKYLPPKYKDGKMAGLALMKHKRTKKKVQIETRQETRCKCGHPMVLMYVCLACGSMEVIT